MEWPAVDPILKQFPSIFVTKDRNTTPQILTELADCIPWSVRLLEHELIKGENYVY
jgi:hypothetical protein